MRQVGYLLELKARIADKLTMQPNRKHYFALVKRIIPHRKNNPSCHNFDENYV
jgi:hypothetical protein